MEREEEGYVTKDDLSRGLNSVFKRNKKETEKIVGEMLFDLRGRVSDNSDDVQELKKRMVNVETAVYPLKESVDNIKEDVKEIKSDIKEGFKELKEDFKEYKEEIKEDVKDIQEDIDCHDDQLKTYGNRISKAESQRGFLGFIKSTEGIVVSIIGVAGPIVVVLIQTYAK